MCDLPGCCFKIEIMLSKDKQFRFWSLFEWRTKTNQVGNARVLKLCYAKTDNFQGQIVVKLKHKNFVRTLSLAGVLDSITDCLILHRVCILGSNLTGSTQVTHKTQMHRWIKPQIIFFEYFFFKCPVLLAGQCRTDSRRMSDHSANHPVHRGDLT